MHCSMVLKSMASPDAFISVSNDATMPIFTPAEYASVVYSDDQKYVGVYPSDYIMVAAGDGADSYTEPDEKADERTFKELHDICVEVIGK